MRHEQSASCVMKSSLSCAPQRGAHAFICIQPPFHSFIFSAQPLLHLSLYLFLHQPWHPTQHGHTHSNRTHGSPPTRHLPSALLDVPTPLRNQFPPSRQPWSPRPGTPYPNQPPPTNISSVAMFNCDFNIYGGGFAICPSHLVIPLFHTF